MLADNFDPMMGQKAAEYSYLMSKIALSINTDNKTELDNLVIELERKPFL